MDPGFGKQGRSFGVSPEVEDSRVEGGRVEIARTDVVVIVLTAYRGDDILLVFA